MDLGKVLVDGENRVNKEDQHSGNDRVEVNKLERSNGLKSVGYDPKLNLILKGITERPRKKATGTAEIESTATLTNASDRVNLSKPLEIFEEMLTDMSL
jgi:hypothetical protein